MNLGQLKAAMSRLGNDNDTKEVFVVTVGPDGERRYELVAGFGYVPIEDTAAAAVVGTSYIDQEIRDGKMEPPEGYVPPPYNYGG
jgi:hypothetical protein